MERTSERYRKGYATESSCVHFLTIFMNIPPDVIVLFVRLLFNSEITNLHRKESRLYTNEFRSTTSVSSVMATHFKSKIRCVSVRPVRTRETAGTDQ